MTYDHNSWLRTEKQRLKQKCEILMLRHREAKQQLMQICKQIDGQPKEEI